MGCLTRSNPQGMRRAGEFVLPGPGPESMVAKGRDPVEPRPEIDHDLDLPRVALPKHPDEVVGVDEVDTGRPRPGCFGHADAAEVVPDAGAGYLGLVYGDGLVALGGRVHAGRIAELLDLLLGAEYEEGILAPNVRHALPVLVPHHDDGGLEVLGALHFSSLVCGAGAPSRRIPRGPTDSLRCASDGHAQLPKYLALPRVQHLLRRVLLPLLEQAHRHD